jgi:hypothetical protein
MAPTTAPAASTFVTGVLILPLSHTQIYVITAGQPNRTIEWDFMSLPATIVTGIPRFLRMTRRELRRDASRFADVIGYGLARPADGTVVMIDRYGHFARIGDDRPEPAIDAALRAMMRTTPGLLGDSPTWRRLLRPTRRP